MISSADPPLLQIRSLLVCVVPASTVPKSITPEVVSHPCSLVSNASSAIGDVVALPVKSMFLLPPLVQNWRRFW